MVLPVPEILRVPRAPFTKPIPGLGINWTHPHSRGLVHSYPINEGRNHYLKNYVWPRDTYDLKWNPNDANIPVWGTYDKVPGLHFPATGYTPPTHIVNTGLTSSETTGANLLPPVDFTKGISVHLWMRPTQSLVGVVTSYAFLTIGPTGASRDTIMLGLSRASDGSNDWWRWRVNVYSNGAASTGCSGNLSIWAAPFDGTFVHIDSLPYEHVVTVHPNGLVRGYSSDGVEQTICTIATGITPPDNNQYWPVIGQDDGLGLGQFEGNLWAINIYNYPMGKETAFSLMRNPLGMYKARASGGQLFGTALPPNAGGGGDPGGGPGGGGLLGDVDICTQLA